MPIEFWESGAEEVYLPVVCHNCARKVSIGGKIKDGVLILDNCPHCNEQFIIKISQGDEAEEVSPFREVKAVIELVNLGKITDIKFQVSNCNTAKELIMETVDLMIGMFSDTHATGFALIDAVLKSYLQMIYTAESQKESMVKFIQNIGADNA